jgi:hypothetical protein
MHWIGARPARASAPSDLLVFATAGHAHSAGHERDRVAAVHMLQGKRVRPGVALISLIHSAIRARSRPCRADIAGDIR